MDHYGWISILPPIIAIVLAIKTRHVLFSLFVGLYFASTALAGWNPILGFSNIIPDFIYNQLASPSNTQSLTNLVIIGGFVALITATGGASAFAELVSKKINSKKKAETSIWLGGLFVWFSDSANSLIVGPIFQPIADKFKVSREKFAYILDATSSPICALIPIISWGVYIMGLIDAELEIMPQVQLTSWEVFIQAIPFQFYSILTLIMVGFLTITQFDFGPMLKAQHRVLNGKLLRDGAEPLRNTKEFELPEGATASAKTIVIPLIIVLTSMFTVFILNGFPKENISGVVIRQGIALGFILGAIAATFLSIKGKILTLKTAEDTIFNGMKDMMFLMVLMTFAWSLGDSCKQLGTAYYIMDVAEGFLNPAFLPAILFIVGAIMSLSTGSSWGPYAILMPIGLPIAISMGSPIAVTVAAIISGGLFGDHCSPLSDTTLLASMGAACDLMDHFRTQFPYALLVAGVSTVLYIIGGLYEVSIIIIPGILVLFVLIYVLHKYSLRKLKQTKSAIS